MENEHEQLDVDRWMRAALSSNAATASRVAEAALGASPDRRSRRGFTAGAAVAALGLVAGVSAWRHSATRPQNVPTIEVSRQDDLLVVRSGDGRTWIVGAEHPRATGGGYAIVVAAPPEEQK